MTVAELVALLAKFPLTSRVLVNGYEGGLPSVRTISNLLNRQDYRLRTVAKSKVQKKPTKPMASSRTSEA